jgi:hypothetical protein
MGETHDIQFTDRGYRQLVMALREARPSEANASAEPEPLAQLTSDGEAAYLDPQGHTRWVKTDRASDVPDTWRPLMIGRSRRETAA